ncbi:MAG: flagellar protein FlaG [SAR324 cluster bacterium]|nr:flagellar protein FlaG [SAR324 cluster bacterium]
MRLFRLLDPVMNRLPTDASRIVRPMRKVPFVSPEAFVSNNTAIQENLAQFDAIDPQKIRAGLRERLEQRVEGLNRQLAANVKFKGITFEVDEDSGRTFAVVKNRETGQVLRTIPSEEMLSRSARLREASGLLKDIQI